MCLLCDAWVRRRPWPATHDSVIVPDNCTAALQGWHTAYSMRFSVKTAIRESTMRSTSSLGQARTAAHGFASSEHALQWQADKYHGQTRRSGEGLGFSLVTDVKEKVGQHFTRDVYFCRWPCLRLLRFCRVSQHIRRGGWLSSGPECRRGCLPARSCGGIR
jgi:hypothetical protein